MEQAFCYLRLQWKRCLLTIFRSICILLAIALVFSGLLFICINVLKVKNQSLVNVGIVMSDDETTTRYVTDLIASMDSVKSICSFEYLEENLAVEKYKEGSLEAVIVLPQGFYHDVQVGLNPPALIYMPENKGLINSVFKELIIAGVSYLQTAEAGVYAYYDAANIYETKEEYANIGNDIALSYVDVIFSRDKMFYSKQVSAFNDITVTEYYLIAFTIILMMFTGLFFYRMYDQSNQAVDNMLKMRGVNRVAGEIIKLTVILPVTFILGLCILSLSMWIGTKLGINDVENTPQLALGLFIISISMSLYFMIIYLLTGEGKKGLFVLVIINVICIACSGLVIPSIYLPSWADKIGSFLPAKYWVNILYQAITGSYGGGL